MRGEGFGEGGVEEGEEVGVCGDDGVVAWRGSLRGRGGSMYVYD